MFETARKASGTVTVVANVALKAGSSQHGKDAARIRRFEMGGQHALAAIRDRIVDEEQAAPELD